MKKYVSPELEVIMFSTEDIIVTSLITEGENNSTFDNAESTDTSNWW